MRQKGNDVWWSHKKSSPTPFFHLLQAYCKTTIPQSLGLTTTSGTTWHSQLRCIPLPPHKHLARTWPNRGRADFPSEHHPGPFQGSRWLVSESWLHLRLWPYLIHSHTPCHQVFPFLHLNRLDRESQSTAVLDGFWGEVVESCHAFNMLRSLHEFADLALRWVFDLPNFSYIRRNNKGLFSPLEITMLRQQKSSMSTIFRCNYSLIDLVQSMLNYSQTFELEKQVTFLGARTSTISQDLNLCAPIWNYSMSVFWRYIRNAKKLVEIRTPSRQSNFKKRW